MRTIRIWLLLLLAVLLPVRGAVAAAMLCPAAGVGTQTELRVGDRAMGHHNLMHVASADHDHPQHDHAQQDHARQHHGSGDHDHGLGSQDKCNLCSAFCSVTPMLSSSPMLPAPQGLTKASFPALSAPAPSFVSDGQERPPRSI